jgi:hypothetical protein
MASTRLVRKALRNRTVAKRRVSTIKRLTSKPVIKNVDIEQIKEEFAKKKATPAAKKDVPVKEAPKAVEKTVEAPKQEKAPKAKATPKAEATPEAVEVEKAAPKKAAAKKTAPKAKKEAAPKAKKEDKASE